MGTVIGLLFFAALMCLAAGAVGLVERALDRTAYRPPAERLDVVNGPAGCDLVPTSGAPLFIAHDRATCRACRVFDGQAVEQSSGGAA